MKKVSKLFVVFLCATMVISCSKTETEGTIPENVQTKNFQKSEGIYTTKANKALLYALVHIYGSINAKENMLELLEKATVVSGKGILEKIDLKAQPYPEEESAFVKEMVYQENSRAILISGIYNPKTNRKGDLVFLSYLNEVTVPENLGNQDGIFLFGEGILANNFEEDTKTCYTGFTGWDCFSCNWYICPVSEYSRCYICPYVPDDFMEYLDMLSIPEMYLDFFVEPIDFEDIKPETPIIEQFF
ncbi:hypothetical protein [uncultured Aquimarina sp.]|uniref:hypothetical protein n=1 Tax=uncultured Aquimarina sp. TaxID=575652 RepID=UPI002604A179|nr:hypothetical protein [uncultured Aquimarina sp.]